MSSAVEKWASYARLRNKGWTQERIGNSKGVTQQTVSIRLQLNDEISNETKSFTGKSLIDEAHLTEIIRLRVDPYLSPWMTYCQSTD